MNESLKIFYVSDLRNITSFLHQYVFVRTKKSYAENPVEKIKMKKFSRTYIWLRYEIKFFNLKNRKNPIFRDRKWVIQAKNTEYWPWYVSKSVLIFEKFIIRHFLKIVYFHSPLLKTCFYGIFRETNFVTITKLPLQESKWIKKDKERHETLYVWTPQ